MAEGDHHSIEDLAANFDHHDEGLDNIFSTYSELRGKCPVGRGHKYGGFWFVTKYEDIYRIEHDSETFKVAPTMIVPPMGNKRPMIPIDLDRPDNLKFRRILLRDFAPQKIDAIGPAVRSVARQLLSNVPDSNEIDASAVLAKPLPTIVFSRMMGLPEEDLPLFHDWVDRIVYVRTHDPEVSRRTVDELYEYFSKLRSRRLTQGSRDDLIGHLLQGEIDGRPLTEDEFSDYCLLLFIAGLETTAWTIRSSLWYLAQHEEDLGRLASDFSLIPTAVEEFIRCFTPSQGMGRTVTQDVEIRGKHVSKGDRLLLLFGSANRDEDEFPDAEEVVIDRRPNRHMSFGLGIHRCLGANLARREIRVALEEFLSIFREFRLVDEDSPWHGIGPLRLRVAPATGENK